MIYRSICLLVSSAKETSMQCNFCHKEITEGGYVWLDKQWCVISHVEPHAGAGLPHICNKCSISLSKKEIIQELMKQHPAHKHAVESIIERCKREGYGITFSNQEIDDLLGLKQPAHCSREEREDFKFERKQGLDNIKRDLLYNYNLRFTGTTKTKKGHGGWCVRHFWDRKEGDNDFWKKSIRSLLSRVRQKRRMPNSYIQTDHTRRFALGMAPDASVTDTSNVLLSRCACWLLGYRFHTSGVKFHFLSDFLKLYIRYTQPTLWLNCGLRLYIHSVYTLQNMIDYLNKYTINLVN